MDTAVKDLFSSWMRWPGKATEMWGKFSENVPRPSWPSWPQPSAGLPFGSPDMASEWMKMSGDLFRRAWAMPTPGVGAETAFKGVDAMQVYWALHEFWSIWARQMKPLSGKDIPDEEVLEAHRKLRSEYERVIKAFLGSPPPQTVQEIMNLHGESFERMISGWSQFRAPWMDLTSSMPHVASKLMSGDLAGMREGTGLWQKAILDTIGKLLNIPAFGMSREQERRVKSAMDAYLNFQAILPVYYSTFQAASREAFERLLAESRELKADTSPEGFKKFYRRWIRIHEDTYYELFHKPEFAELMNRVVNRGLNLRQRMNEITSSSLEVWNVPTREELDDVYQTLYTQRNQIKALTRRLDELEGLNSTRTPLEA